jgi:photosystem II stability/assembly factor-like uncharacterized protein
VNWIAAFVVAVLVAGCVDAPSAEPAKISHVHIIIVVDDGVMLATHRGVVNLDVDWKISSPAPGPDLMSMARASDGTLYAGGHPAQITAAGPKHLGLATSSDGGATWTSISMEGQVDLHAMTVLDDDVYTFWGDSMQRWTGNWEPLEGPQTVLALTHVDGQLLAGTPEGISAQTDSGWAPIASLGPITAVAATPSVIYAATSYGPEGQGIRSIDGGTTWSVMPVFIEAPYSLQFGVDPTDPERAVAADFQGRIYETLDAGASWTQRI